MDDLYVRWPPKMRRVAKGGALPLEARIAREQDMNRTR